MTDQCLPKPLYFFSSFVEKISHSIYYLGMASVFFMMFPIVIDVISRLILHYSIPGAIELTEISMFFLVTLCFAYPETTNSHMHVELIYEKLSPRIQNVLMFFHLSISVMMTSIMTYYMYELMMEKFEYLEYTPDLELPVYIFFCVATLGVAIFFLAVVRNWLLKLYAMFQKRHFLDIVLGLAAAVIFCASPWILKDTSVSSNMGVAGTLGVVTMIALLLLRMPIGVAMGSVGILGMMLIYPDTLSGMSMTGLAIHHTGASYIYSVVPMFILMGEIALYSGISSEIFRSAKTCLGHVPGGLCVASVAGCSGFAAICGDSLATAMTMGSVALPEMKKYNYSMGLSTACLAAGGTLGILIPPSVGFIFYAVVTEESLGKLFLAGIIPGLLLATLFCITIVVLVKRNPALAPSTPNTSLAEKLRSLTGILPMIALIFLVLGGILTGICSPTEGGAIGSFGTLLYALCSGKLSRKSLIASLQSTCFTTTRVMFMLIGVGILGYFFAATRLPFLLADAIVALNINRWLVFCIIICVYILLGCLMNVIPMILLTLPALFPTVVALGFDPVWFGVITVIMMEMGQITPPVGIVVFSISGLEAAPPMGDTFRHIMPFIGCMLLGVFLMSLFPQMALFLPSLLI